MAITPGGGNSSEASEGLHACSSWELWKRLGRDVKKVQKGQRLCVLLRHQLRGVLLLPAPAVQLLHAQQPLQYDLRACTATSWAASMVCPPPEHNVSPLL